MAANKESPTAADGYKRFSEDINVNISYGSNDNSESLIKKKKKRIFRTKPHDAPVTKTVYTNKFIFTRLRFYLFIYLRRQNPAKIPLKPCQNPVTPRNIHSFFCYLITRKKKFIITRDYTIIIYSQAASN